MNSKRKGSTGERELAGILRSHGFDSHRNDQMYVGGKDNPDVSLDGVHIECKRTERLSLYDALAQATRDAGGATVPVVMHRKNHAPWVVVMTLDQWVPFYLAWMEDTLPRGHMGDADMPG